MEKHAWPWDKSLDATIAAPNSHKVLLENDQTRVVEVVILAGHREPAHTHEWPSVMIVDQSTKIIYYDANGKGTEYPARDVSGGKPFVEWLEPEELHAVENLENRPYHAIRIEFKS